MPTFCRKPHVASFYSSLIQPYIKLYHRQTEFGHTDEIIYVRFRRYICISFVNFLLRKKYIAQLKYTDHQNVYEWIMITTFQVHLIVYIVYIYIHSKVYIVYIYIQSYIFTKIRRFFLGSLTAFHELERGPPIHHTHRLQKTCAIKIYCKDDIYDKDDKHIYDKRIYHYEYRYLGQRLTVKVILGEKILRMI